LVQEKDLQRCKKFREKNPRPTPLRTKNPSKGGEKKNPKQSIEKGIERKKQLKGKERDTLSGGACGKLC